MSLKSLRNWLGGRARERTNRCPRRKSALALALEHLEDRTTPTAVSWDGGGGNSNWLNALNWSNDTLPTLSDDVTISGATGGVEINDTFGTAAARTLISSSDLRVISGTLQLGGDSLVTGAFTLAGVTFGGVVTGSGTLTLSGATTWGVNGVMAGTGKTVLTGTSTLAGSTFGSIRESRVVENAGGATLLAGNSFTFRDNTVFRNLAGATLTVGGGAGFGTFFAGTGARFVNAGTVTVEGPGTTTVGVLTENSGTITTAGASLSLTGLTNSGAVEVAGGALNTGSTLTNSGTVAVSGGNLTVSGPGTSSGDIRLAGGASMLVTNTAFTPAFLLSDGATVTGGPVVLNTFEKMATSGSVEADAIRLAGGNLDVLTGGSLAVGTLEQSGNVTGSGSITVAGAWTFTSGTLTATGNLTVGGPVNWTGGTLTGTGTATINGNLNWSGGTMSGTGRTVLNGAGTLSGALNADNRQIENAGAATVASGGLTFRNAARWTNLSGSVFEVRGGEATPLFFSTGQFVNQGTIRKTTTGTAAIRLPVVNQSGGVIDVDEGTLQLFGNSNSLAGASDIASGATLSLNGTTTLQSGATVTGAGELLVAGTTLTVAGPLSVSNFRTQGGTVALNGALTVGNFTHTGTLNGAADLTVNGALAWSAGSMTGTGRTFLNGTTTISGSVTANTRQIENAGSATVTAGGLALASARWTNLTGSVFEVRSGDAVTSSGTAPQFVNRGTVRKTTTALASLRPPVVNEAGGVIEVQQGTLQLFATNSSSAGAFDIAAGATLSVLSGSNTFTLQAGATSVGAGEFFVSGSSVTVAGAASVNNLRMQGGTVTANANLTVGNLTGNSGTLTGPANVTVNGTLLWTTGGMSGTGKTIVNGTGTIGGGTSAIAVNGRTIENAGTVTLATTSTLPLQFQGGAAWNNLPGSTLVMPGTATISNFFASTTSAVNNAGTIRKTGAAGNISQINVPLINSGRLEIQGGDLTTAPNSRNSGAVDIASAGRWVLNNGATFFDAGATTTGAGVLFIQGGALTVTGAASIARLQQMTSTTTVNAALAVGDYLFNAGTLTGTGRTTLTGNSSFTSSSLKLISNHTIDNVGTLTWSQTGEVRLTNSTFNNLAGATFDVTNDAAFTSAGGTTAFNNAGTLLKSAGGGPIFPAGGLVRTLWSVPINNSGLLDIRAGNFQPVPPTGLPASTPMLANTGTIQVGTATSSAAALVLPVVSVAGLPTFTLAGGTLTGTGQVGLPGPTSNLIVAPGATLGGTVTVWGSVVNRGTVQPGTTAGTLTVQGNYTQVDDATADGRLVIGLRGDSPSGLFGKLQVNGTANLSGALEVFADGGFLPDFGDVFQVFRSVGPRTGDFTYPEGGYDLDGYRVLTHQYDGTGLRLNLVTGVGALPVIDPIDDITVNGKTFSKAADNSNGDNNPAGPLATIDPSLLPPITAALFPSR